jgi:hypothetical protein
MHMSRRWFQWSKWRPCLRSILSKSSILLCVFCAKRTQCKGYSKEMFPVYSAKCLSCKAVHNWVKKFSQGCLKVADDAWPGCPAVIATEATVQQVEELIQANKRMTIDSVAMVSHRSTPTSMIVWCFGKCARCRLPVNWRLEEKK